MNSGNQNIQQNIKKNQGGINFFLTFIYYVMNSKNERKLCYQFYNSTIFQRRRNSLHFCVVSTSENLTSLIISLPGTSFRLSLPVLFFLCRFFSRLCEFNQNQCIPLLIKFKYILISSSLWFKQLSSLTRVDSDF